MIIKGCNLDFIIMIHMCYIIKSYFYLIKYFNKYNIKLLTACSKYGIIFLRTKNKICNRKEVTRYYYRGI